MGLSRLELLTLHLSGVYSNQLSYKPFFSPKKAYCFQTSFFFHSVFYLLYTECAIQSSYLDTIAMDGVSPSGKALDFGSSMQRFESFYSRRKTNDVPVAQLDRALDYGSKG